MSDADTLEHMEGLFVGLLDDDEAQVLEDAIERGRAMRSYEGAGGLMGMAKVRLLPLRTSNTTPSESTS